MDTNVKTCSKVGVCTHKNIADLGAWVYSGLCENQIFKRFDTIAEAVAEAVEHTGAHVLHNGIEIMYGRLTDNAVYYKCINTGEIIVINI